MQNKNRKVDICVLIFIVVSILYPIIRLGNVPGIYLDAINPDYAATQILWPAERSVRWMAAWPWLAQLYHGNLTILPTLISLLITKNTSVMQLHIVNGIMASICIMQVYYIMKLQKCRLFSRLCMVVLGVTLPTVFLTTMTQYYIELCGTMFSLTAVIFFILWENNQKNEKLCTLSYLFLGVAFYGYFNFLFFLPSLLFATYVLNPIDRIRRIIKGMLAFFAGCGGYFIGYSQIVLCRWVAGKRLFAMMCCVILAFYGIIYICYRAFCSESKEAQKRVFLACVIVLCVWCVIVVPVIIEAAKGLDVQGTKGSFFQRIELIVKYLKEANSGTRAEKNIYRMSVAQMADIPLAMYIMVTVFVTGILFRRKVPFIKWSWPLGVITLYSICAIVLATRMQVQHFIPTIFLFLMLLGFQIERYIYIYISSRWKNVIKIALIGIVVVVVCLNTFNTYRITMKIKETGGKHYYSNQINELAYEANENLNDGKKELYVFKEWGFIFGFNYLTKNQIEIMTYYDDNYFNQRLHEGYEIIVCSWSEEGREEARNEIKSIAKADKMVTEEIRYENDGSIAFYLMRVS